MANPGPILIVDDEPHIREALEHVLRRSGYEVHTAPEAVTGLRLIEERSFPLVITDLHMPGLSGLDFMSEVRIRSPRTLCVVITGFASTEAAVESLKRGAYDFIQKPVRIPEVESLVARALDHAQALASLEAYQQRLEELVLERTQELESLYSEMLGLNEMLVAAQGERDLGRVLHPFLQHLRNRWRPDEDAVLIPEGISWRVAAQSGPRTWSIDELGPRLGRLEHPAHLTAGLGSLHEAFLVPLKHRSTVLAVLLLGFRQRSSFSMEDSRFRLWCRQLEAGLYGWSQLPR